MTNGANTAASSERQPSDDQHIPVNCGRCGSPFVMRLGDLRGKWTVECPLCTAKHARASAGPRDSDLLPS